MFTIIALLLVAAVRTPADAATAPSGVPGVDVSNYQGSVNWAAVRNAGVRWTYILATDGLNTPNRRYFAGQYNGAFNAGIIRGSYHYARFSVSDGTTQARYFVMHGGGWSPDGMTLPGALDLEGRCGADPASTRRWIAQFLNEYRRTTRRDAVIYTTPNWWATCVGSWPQVTSRFPLWISNTRTTRPRVPSGWGYYTMWQWVHGEDGGRVSGVTGGVDQNVFNGTVNRLQAFARG
ncbi:GH25 family lysozyme [Cryptosporangium phraense]|uniref:GH25 family lysozyme n=1 Tax=Cryptosporangium phraense TaxID=2593070 RepID=UPI00197AD6E6|nr:GH25 family lysozyme [Cryptosporangium phraense]